MDKKKCKELWKYEEGIAHIKGWDFSHLDGRWEEREPPWNYDAVVRGCLAPEHRLLDYDTGGGEYLLSLRHPYRNTAATEGYPPNAALCRERLLPLGIDWRECGDPARIPFADQSFDRIINRHGAFDPKEIYHLLRANGIFVTQQVGRDNDRDLVEMVLPGTEQPYPELYLEKQRHAFEQAGFRILRAEEAHQPICFYDVGAFVWFARIIEWEFPGFSVERCFDALLAMQERLEEKGKIAGTTHRFLLVAQK